MLLYRVCETRYAASADLRDHARGSLLVDGRWHTRDQMTADGGLLYTSSSAALASSEKLVHLDKDTVPDRDYTVVEYAADVTEGNTLAFVVTAAVPWSLTDTRATAYSGSQWYRQQPTAMMTVPSIILPLDLYDPFPRAAMRNSNVLVNTAHPDAARLVRVVRRVAFPYDRRLYTI